MCVYVCVCECVVSRLLFWIESSGEKKKKHKKPNRKHWFSVTTPHDLMCNKKAISSYPTTRVIRVLWTKPYKDNSLLRKSSI